VVRFIQEKRKNTIQEPSKSTSGHTSVGSAVTAVPIKKQKIATLDFFNFQNKPCFASGTQIESLTWQTLLNQYLLSAVDDSVNPLAYWSLHPDRTAENIALKVLSIPATSAAVERLFSRAGRLIQPLRSRLLPATVEKLLFLSYND